MSDNPTNFRKVLVALLLLCGGVLLVTKMIGRSAPTYNATVSGTVTIGGILAESGVVTFHPLAGGQPAMGNIHADGSFSLRSGQGDLSNPDGGTIASGGYVVTVAVSGPTMEGDVVGVGGPPVPGPSLVAVKYRSKAASGLSRVVKPGENVFVLNLERAESGESAVEAEIEPAEGEPVVENGAETDSYADQELVSEEVKASEVEDSDSTDVKD